MYRFLKIICWPFCWLLFPAKRVNKKKYLDKKKNYILLCNHTSSLDAVVIMHHIHRTLRVVAKKELFRKKCNAWFLRTMHVIPIDRQKMDLTAVKTCISSLKEGKTLLIFPEGTRNKTGEDLQEIKNGSAMFSIKTGVEILPIRIQKRPRLFRFNTITFGEPFSLSQFEGQRLTKDVLDEASKIITEKLENL